mgnify:CR=1 FL=1
MTDIYFSFDTEDFTCDRSSDAIRDQANILHKYGIKGNFNLAGFLARELVRNRRFDVLDALKNHVISTHTYRHSYHPTIGEYTDIDDFDAAYRQAERMELEGLGMVKAATGVDRIASACPPGWDYAYVSMYLFSDLGMPIFNGSFHLLPGSPGVYMCNAYQLDYFTKELEVLFYSPDYSPEAVLDELATQKQAVLCNHPNMVLHKDFWDAVNYCRSNQYPWGEWKEPECHTEEEVAMYYARLRDLIERLQADERFCIKDFDQLTERLEKAEAARLVTKEMLPQIQKNLEKELLWMHDPADLSVADCFFAAKHFMDSDRPYKPGKVHGFLYQPRGITRPVTLTAEQVRRMAADADPAKFLPPVFTTDGVEVGPADLLFAMLAVAQGAEEVTLTPRAQQINLDHLPWIRDIFFNGTWMFMPSYEDKYNSDRLRLQAWTARVEE